MKIKLISSLEKCFLDETIDLKQSLRTASFLKNERFRFGAAYTVNTSPAVNENKKVALLDVGFAYPANLTVWRVEHLPVKLAVNTGTEDKDFLRFTPGLYPDMLSPLPDHKRLMVSENLESLFFEIDPAGMSAGTYPFTVRLLDPVTKETLAEDTCTFTVLDAFLPEQTLKVTQWFYCDCLQKMYGTGAFDEAHWRIIENFAAMAVKHGINMLFTPIFTPALDTQVGGERPATQLVDVWVENGEYRFGFDKLSRWVDMCDRLGVKYFEISHFFTQWGAAHAPKIMATVDGTEKRIFGWDTKADGEEYSVFLRAFIPALLQFMKSKNGADRRCWFHVSDEPNGEQLDSYRAARAVVKDLLNGYPVMDALSEYDFYEQGIVECPVPATDHIEPFIENGVQDLWCYYCFLQDNKVSNRFIAMPSYRNRIIGTQFYKYHIAGFLHWGYNFYFNQYSFNPIHPYLCTDGDYFGPAGDAFSVYPGPDGVPYPSLRLLVFHDALQDLGALQLCERLYDRDFVLSLLEAEGEITFSEYPRNLTFLPDLREKINAAIAAKT